MRAFGLLMIVIMGLALAACQDTPQNTLPSGGTSAFTPMPRTPAPTGPVPPVAAPLYGDEETVQPINLEVKVIHENASSPGYQIEARYPYLTGSGSPYLAGFNQSVEALVLARVNSFLQSLESANDDAGLLQIDFLPTLLDENIASVYLRTSAYKPGAAHFSNGSLVINYDLRSGQTLALADLFQPGTNYLQGIAQACSDELKARDRLNWEEGVLPREENYQNWNITPQGLLITFDEYRVASYAAGAQTVLIPYDRLSDVILSNGPLSPYLP